MGSFTPTPSAPTPCKTSRFKRVPRSNLKRRVEVGFAKHWEHSEKKASSEPLRARNSNWNVKFRRATIQGAQPSARLSEENCLSERSQGPLTGSLRGFCGVSAGLCRGLRDFPRVVTLSLWPWGTNGLTVADHLEENGLSSKNREGFYA